jgi:hypothetical protein
MLANGMDRLLLAAIKTNIWFQGAVKVGQIEGLFRVIRVDFALPAPSPFSPQS